MKSGPSVKPLFLAIAFLCLASSALKLSDIVQLRKKLHKMESEVGTLPEGRKLAAVNPPLQKDTGLTLQGKAKKSANRKLKAELTKSVSSVGGSGGVQLLSNHAIKKPARRLKTHRKAHTVKRRTKKSKKSKARRAVTKVSKAAKKRSKGRGLKDLVPGTAAAGNRQAKQRAFPGTAKFLKKSVSIVPQTKATALSRKLKHVPAAQKLLNNTSRHTAKAKKLKGNRKGAAKKLKAKKKKAAKKLVNKKKQKRKNAQAVPSQNPKTNLSGKANNRVAKQDPSPLATKESLALDAMNSAVPQPHSSPAPTVTERKLLDLPSQNEFYEQIVNNYYPTI